MPQLLQVMMISPEGGKSGDQSKHHKGKGKPSQPSECLVTLVTVPKKASIENVVKFTAGLWLASIQYHKAKQAFINVKILQRIFDFFLPLGLFQEEK